MRGLCRRCRVCAGAVQLNYSGSPFGDFDPDIQFTRPIAAWTSACGSTPRGSTCTSSSVCATSGTIVALCEASGVWSRVSGACAAHEWLGLLQRCCAAAVMKGVWPWLNLTNCLQYMIPTPGVEQYK
jgi:hypothetical protein